MNPEDLIKRICAHTSLPGASSIGEVLAAAGLHPEEMVHEVLAAADSVSVPAAPGLRDRVSSALQRIIDGHAPRRIPADPTDVDLVLSEVLSLLDGRPIPFWLEPKSHSATPVVEKAREEKAPEPLLWCVHVLGPDEIFPAPSKEYAELAAAMHNKIFTERAAKLGIKCEAVAAPYPGDPALHAAGVGNFILEWLVPQWQSNLVGEEQQARCRAALEVLDEMRDLLRRARAAGYMLDTSVSLETLQKAVTVLAACNPLGQQPVAEVTNATANCFADHPGDRVMAMLYHPLPPNTKLFAAPWARPLNVAAVQEIARDLLHSAKVDDYEAHHIAFIESVGRRLNAVVAWGAK